MNYHFKIHRARPGYWAECIELTGCVTQAETMEALRKNMQEALNLYLDEPVNSAAVIPPPDNTLQGKHITNVEVEPAIAFGILLRTLRIAHNLTQRETALKLGMKNIYSYQRLERKANPTLNMLGKVKSLFPEMDIASLL